MIGVRGEFNASRVVQIPIPLRRNEGQMGLREADAEEKGLILLRQIP
jgi:hypothetical protein